MSFQFNIDSHQCPNCARTYVSISEDSYQSYSQTCRSCLENKIYILEEQVKFLYKFFDTVNQLKIR